MDRQYSCKIVQGVIVRTYKETQIPNNITFYGRERRFSEKSDNNPIREEINSFFEDFRPPSLIAQPIPQLIPQLPIVEPIPQLPIIEEVDISDTITGPPLEPYGDFFLPCKKDVDIAAIIFFPLDTDPAFSFSDESFQKRMYFMSMEMNVYGRRILNIEQAISSVSDIMLNHSIVHMEIGGHGDGISIQLPEQTISIGEDSSCLELLFNMMVPDSTVLLLSCRGGGPIIDYLANIGLGHRFIGVECDLGPNINLKVESACPLQVKYTTNSGRDVTVIRKY